MLETIRRIGAVQQITRKSQSFRSGLKSAGRNMIRPTKSVCCVNEVTFKRMPIIQRRISGTPRSGAHLNGWFLKRSNSIFQMSPVLHKSTSAVGLIWKMDLSRKGGPRSRMHWKSPRRGERVGDRIYKERNKQSNSLVGLAHARPTCE